MQKTTIFNLHLIEYEKAWKFQEKIFKQIIQSKLNDPLYHNALIFCEHPHVFTLGKHGNAGNFLIKEEFLAEIKARFVRTNRGGDITYHGPGQIVGYLIFDLQKMGLGIREYIFRIEEAIIKVLSDYGMVAAHYDKATGVWLDVDDPQAIRKICAIGVKVSKQVTMHGFALNVNTNLDYFSYINPCGFKDKGVTSIQKELGYSLNMDEVRAKVKHSVAEEFNLDILDE